ncbi:MAG: choline dehydrogenase-like flavoprotein [Planctomycetota bacterium]|jgi:choline dehydrogenase-like flavoprotein
MIRDLGASESAPAGGLDYDVVVIGSGPAGGVVVAELRRARPELTICVLESGRLRPGVFADKLRRTPYPGRGIRIKPHSRERVLGGASTTWSGLSSPMDPIEMEPRPWLEQSGWPMSPAELAVYYQGAADRYRFAPPVAFDPKTEHEAGLASIRAKGKFQPTWDAVEEKIFLAAEDPQDFGAELKDQYESGGVDLWLDASVTRLVAEAGRVVSAQLATSKGEKFDVRGGTFVLGCGGIENARLLLNSELPNEHDVIGRYMMNHPKNYCGVVTLSEPTRSLPYFFGCIWKGFAGYGGLRLPDAKQREEQLVNSYVRFEPLFPWSDNRGVEALVHLVKRSKFLLTGWKKTKKDELIELRDYSETGDDSELDEEHLSYFGLIARLLRHLPSVLAYVKSRILDRGGPLIKRVRIRNFMEMEPVAANRVVLSTDASEVDSFGMALPIVQHDTAERDRRSLLLLHEALKAELSRTGFGDLYTDLADQDPWPISQDASHHIGTTRMGSDPTFSVVDNNLKFHGLEGLYVSGASVFPTSGCANPTYTIVALAIRLGEHLAQELPQVPGN